MHSELIFAIYHHEYLGYLVAPFLVKKTSAGSFSLDYKKITKATMHEYPESIGPENQALITLLEETDPQFLVKKLHKQTIKPVDYFLKYFTDETSKVVRNGIEVRLAKFFKTVDRKLVYVMGKDGYPAWRNAFIHQEPISVLFHLKRNDTETRYYPTLLHNQKLVKFQNNDSALLTAVPPILLTPTGIYSFENGMDSQKIKPFLNKYYIQVPVHAEQAFFEKFFLPLLEKFPVKAEGITIKIQKPEAKAILSVDKGIEKPGINLYFKYEDKLTLANNSRWATAFIAQNGPEQWVFVKTERKKQFEDACKNTLLTLGLVNTSGAVFQPKGNYDFYGLLEWLGNHFHSLTERGFEVQMQDDTYKYYLRPHTLEVKINEDLDWFGLKAIVKLGEYEIPFIRLKNHILNGIRTYTLPNGETAILPSVWFEKLAYAFALGHTNQEQTSSDLLFPKSCFEMLNGIVDSDSLKVTLPARTIQKSIVQEDLPKNAIAIPRVYQKAGYDWLLFLNKNGFGGCLADDMGLGKTIQTILFLQKKKEDLPEFALKTLLIVPASLMYNWQKEILKFAPELSQFIYAGNSRETYLNRFLKTDITITSYNIFRIDQDIFKRFSFNYVIIDEAQTIKNPSAATAKAIFNISAPYKLALTGTPIENTLTDLWSIFHFLNPGMLGTLTWFNQNFTLPIEKKKDEVVAERLKNWIKPLMLRRTKRQVADDLPDKVEKRILCNMTEAQEQLYEQVKSSFRNQILTAIQENGIGANSFLLLRGLTQLRQIANHPAMIQPEYEGSSGKFDQVLDMILTAIAEGHKVLVFSQFVKHLSLIRNFLNQSKTNYLYLDGQTPAKERQEMVDHFNAKENPKLFLLSLKAGGLGLNLTAADYVFVLDPWWNPAIEQQAVDRSHRIGQKKTVFAYQMITQNTIEEKIVALQERKKDLSDKIIQIESSFIKSLTLEDIQTLFN